MRSLTRLAFVAAVALAVLGTASAVYAAPTLGPGVGWNQGHRSYPGLCTECHSFRVWPAPAIAAGTTPTHGPRGTKCTDCHTVNSVPAPAPTTAAPALAAASAVSRTQVTLAWSPVEGAAGYRIYRSTAAAGPFASIGTTTAVGFADSGRAAGTMYYYRVCSLDGTGTPSLPSPTSSARTYATASVKSDSTITGARYTGTGWKTISSRSFYAGSTRSSAYAGARATISFRGSSFVWYGSRGPGFGKAAVYVDGKYYKTVDLYSSTSAYQRALVSRTGMTDGPHTLAIVISSSKNTRSKGRRVDVDAFTFGGMAPGANREESLASWSTTFTPLPGSMYSGGMARSCADASATITMSFRGTGVTLVGAKGPGLGRARVYVDDVLVGTTDAWATHYTSRLPLMSKTGLPLRTHTVRVEPLSTGGPFAAGQPEAGLPIEIDAFVVR